MKQGERAKTETQTKKSAPRMNKRTTKSWEQEDQEAKSE